ncbi:MAG: RICIN domain-containing protein [Burkholderiaceae bacterium]|nr:RICIN domain-containing protein [Burkholderiaceae bacterium]
MSYISPSAGYVLHAAGDGAVIANWAAQAPLQGFSGFGQVHLAGRCLTGKASGQQLRWEGCRVGDKAQVWSLSSGALVNDMTLCAEVQGAPAGNAPVVSNSCNRSPGQRWNGLAAAPPWPPR